MDEGKVLAFRFSKFRPGRNAAFRLTALILAVVLYGWTWAPIIEAAADTNGANESDAKEESAQVLVKFNYEKIEESPVAPGTLLQKYIWHSEENEKTIVHVLQVDLKNPYVELDVMTGVDNQFAKRQSVRGMAEETGAVAGINGDFFVMQSEGAPLGPQMSDGELMSSPPFLEGFYTFAITEDREPLIDIFQFSGRVIAEDGASYPLAGLNKAVYWINGMHSHIDALFLYDSRWGSVRRANDGATIPTEVLIEDGRVSEVKVNGTIQQVPPKDGYILRASGKAADFVKEHLQPGDRIEIEYDIFPADPESPIDTGDIEMMIGGHTILVDEGQPAKYSRDIKDIDGFKPRSRSAVGYTKNKRFVYLIAAEKNANSRGMSLDELQRFMLEIGVWKGVNLDGGGSTQLVARPLGEITPALINRTEYGGERDVVNAIGIYSNAPKGQKIEGQIINGKTLLFLRETAEYELRQYDEFYNPVIPDAESIKWTLTEPVGVLKDNTFLPLTTGKTQIKARTEHGEAVLEVEVAGRKQIKNLSIIAPQLAPVIGTPIPVSVRATTKNGQTRTLPPEAVEWDWFGMEAQVTDGKLVIDAITGDQIGLIANYDGFSTILTYKVGDTKTWLNLDDVNPYLITSKSDPSDAQIARVSIEQDGENDRSLGLEYDFTQTLGGEAPFTSAAAYAVFGENGVTVAGSPQVMSLDVWGDGSGNKILIDIEDGNRTLQTIELAENINWEGWKTLQVNLTPYASPIKIRNIHIRIPEEKGRAGSLKGQIRVDNIRFTYKGTQPAPKNPKMQMKVGDKTIITDGVKSTMEQAPVIINDWTYVPVRFVVENMGGEVDWDGEHRKVTVLRGNQMVELYIDEPEMIVNGQAVALPAPPLIRNNWTMLPLRGISEAFGWEIFWDENTRTIILE